VSNPSVSKRQKEKNRQDKAREKQARRQDRIANPRPVGAEGEDPDIAGIIPGPQPIPEEDQ
jgi:hypothetical protein